MQGLWNKDFDMWKRKFFTVFSGELGVDVGGVTRELFICLCDQLFGAPAKNSLFIRFDDDNPQALVGWAQTQLCTWLLQLFFIYVVMQVHPTPHKIRDPSLKLEHYEFAGRVVGKCLYESALGNPLFVKARFTRSFLAQIIGLRVTWKVRQHNYYIQWLVNPRRMRQEVLWRQQHRTHCWWALGL